MAAVEKRLAAGGDGWFAEETTLRECPPLRAGWARRGEQAVVTISGRNSRRVLHGALNLVTGEGVRGVRERSRGVDSAALVAALAARTAAGRSVLVWDNVPPHQPHIARERAAATGIAIVPLPLRAPALMPCADVWRGMKGVVAANRAYADVDELAGLQSSTFDWLPT